MTDSTSINMNRQIYVAVETRNQVAVFGSPEMRGTGFEARDFAGPSAFQEAVAYAKREAKKHDAKWTHDGPASV